jgi:integrase
VDLGPDPNTGKRRQSSGTFKGDDRAAAVALAEFVARERNNAQAPSEPTPRVFRPTTPSVQPSSDSNVSEDLTWTELFEKWVISPGKNQKRKAATTQYQERKRYERHVKAVFGERLVGETTHNEIQEYYDRLSTIPLDTDESDKFVLSHTSVTRIHQLLRAMCRFGIRRDLISRNPFERISFTVREPPPPVAPELKTVAMLLSWLYANDRKLWLAVRLAAECGLRRSEIIGLRWSAIGEDSASGLKSVMVGSGIVVVPGVNKPRYITTETKTGKRGTGVLGIDNEFAKEIDKMWFELIDSTDDALAGDGYIFSDDNGVSCWHPDTLSARLKVAREQAAAVHYISAMNEVTFKSLRAYTATRLQNLGYSAITATAVLRHDQAATAEKFYIAGNAALERRATASIGDEFNSFYDDLMKHARAVEIEESEVVE